MARLGFLERRRARREVDAVLRSRVGLLAAALRRPAPAAEVGVPAALAQLVDPRSRAEVWLTLAVLTAHLPDEVTVVEAARTAEFDDRALYEAVIEDLTEERLRERVRVQTGGVLMDVAHTTSSPWVTGIQRVVREVAKRWVVADRVTPISWTLGFGAPRDLSRSELDRTRAGIPNPGDGEDRGEIPTVVIPWRTTLLVPELATEPHRTKALRALGRFGVVDVRTIGFDLIPLTSAETTGPEMSSAFARTMTFLRHATHVAAISEAAAGEYRGWRAMLQALGQSGPEVSSVELPVDATDVSQEALNEARRQFVLDGLPLVLVVGSHEPRKNHLAVLHAAELLWREGHHFSLTFAGGNSWLADRFRDRLAELQRAGRPVESVSKVSEDELWSLYRLARFTVFPSFNEGYGLPVAESLAVGTPAITSDFGSMAGIAAGGGALTVDPRSDVSLRDAMRALLTDDDLLARLRREASARPRRTWDDYAADLWRAIGEPAHPV